ncbi:MAG TPA: hypothetical protein PKC89_15065 [Pyrinomonadaceae bacterium]|nr:hypothetical protein [Pyrinomonadaceae bacterium]
MNENGSTPPELSLEEQFMLEPKSEGSLSLFVANEDGNRYIGWDLNPEDIEALYFEGIGVPRWESLTAETVEEQTAIYWERFNERMDKFPLLGRTRDTDVDVDYTSAEVPPLMAECESIAAATSNAKALRALQKLLLAAGRVATLDAGFSLKPSHSR